MGAAVALGALAVWLFAGLLLGLLEWPYQLLSELGFALQQRLWLEVPGSHGLGAAQVFAAALALTWLAWGPLAGGRGGGITPSLALQQNADAPALLERLDLITQLRRLPLMLLTHLGGLTVGVESPSAALGSAFLLALRRRWPRFRPWAALPLPLVAAIGGGAGLGAAFRSPLLGVAYAIEELSREKGLSLVLPTLLLAGSGALVNTQLGQPARLTGLDLGPLSVELWGWALLITLLGAVLGSLFVRLLIPTAAWLARQLRRRRLPAALAVAALLALLALLSGGLSLNDGSLSLAAALQGQQGGTLATLLWRFLASLLSIAAGAPGGVMHDTMTLGALLASPLQALPEGARAQLAAVGATALFAAANRTPIFCALFVFTLQADPQLLPQLLLVSAVSGGLAERWRGSTWNEAQLESMALAPGVVPGLAASR
ncbi:MAG: chloride channel protein [Cyanobacteria bacterium J06638_7]